ncbi:MAG: anthranilate phosphoribosyltransferase [Actinomycetota bacterium]
MTEHTWPEILGELFAARSITAEQSEWAMRSIMSGDAGEARLAAFLGALSAKEESVDEIIGLVRTMREMGQKVEVDFPVVDTCGTGGDRAGTINISTIAAFVVAGTGAKVAKHGNRAASSQCGSADVLEALGVRIDLGPRQVAQCIEEAGIGFCFAPVFHPAMRHAGPVRSQLGVPTVFNFLGPLTNPAGAQYQAVGVSRHSMAPKMAEALRILGSVHALLFRSRDGLDELSAGAPADVWEMKDGAVSEFVFDPASLGVGRSESGELKGGTPQENAEAALRILGGEVGPARDVVALNAAAAIVAGGGEPDFPSAFSAAQSSIDSGAAKKALEAMISVSTKLAES